MAINNDIETEKKEALSETENLYDGMASEAENYYQSQIDVSNQWAETQKRLQQERTDLAIEQIEQQKEVAKKDYMKEQSGAYTDWQKQSNPYGARAEQLADMGMQHTGYSESSQVGMYNTYQNRVSAARESYDAIILSYNNAIKEAKLQNSSALAEIAYNAMQQQLELSLQGFQYKNNLLMEKANQKASINSDYQKLLAEIEKEEEITTYEQAVEELRRAGATEGDGGLMTKSEWNRRKASGSTAKVIFNNDTYEEYLINFIDWKKENPDE